MKKFLAVAVVSALCMAGMSPANAQYDLSAFNTPVTESFTSYAGTAAPTNWTAVGNTGPSFQGEGTGSSATGGFWSYGETASTERALGYLGNGTTAQSVDLTASFANTTGLTISELAISFDAEQWRSVLDGRINGWALSISTDGIVFDPIAAGNLSTWESTNALATGALDGNANSSTRSGSITGLSILDTSTFFLRWSADRGTGGGSSQGIAIDNISVTAVPEPSTMALLGCGAIGLAVYAKRRRR